MNYADPTDQTVPIEYWRQEAEWAFMELRETFIMSKTKLFKGRGGFEKAYEGFKEQVKPWLARRDRDHLGALVVTESENWALRFFGLHLAYFMEHMLSEVTAFSGSCETELRAGDLLNPPVLFFL